MGAQEAYAIIEQSIKNNKGKIENIESTQTIVYANRTPFILFIAIIIIILIIFLLSENTNNPIFKQIMEIIKKVNMIVALPTFLLTAIKVFEFMSIHEYQEALERSEELVDQLEGEDLA